MSHLKQLRTELVDRWERADARPETLGDAAITTSYEGGELWTRLNLRGAQVYQVCVAAFPACATLAITTSVNLVESYRRQRVGLLLRNWRLAALRAAGFRGEVVTVRDDNVAQVAIMNRTGGVRVATHASDHGGVVGTWFTPLAGAEVSTGVNQEVLNRLARALGPDYVLCSLDDVLRSIEELRQLVREQIAHVEVMSRLATVEDALVALVTRAAEGRAP